MTHPLAQDTLRSLSDVFPSFADWWAEAEAPLEGGVVNSADDEWTHHRVMVEFLVYFSRHHAQFGDQQLKRLGDWINQAVSDTGDLENAVSTCFLEHMRQVRISGVLAPYLSKAAKAKSHA